MIIAIVGATTALMTIVYILLIGFFSKGWNKSQTPVLSQSEPLIFVSVLVAFRNEAANLPKLLNSLLQQSYPAGSFEIILINDGSTDQWANAITAFNAPHIKILSNSGIGKKQALKTGAKAAKGTLLLFTDADCLPHKHWIYAMGELWHKQQAALIIGPVMLTSDDSFLHRFQQIDFLSLQISTAGAAFLNRPIMCNGANLAIDTSYYLQIQNLKQQYLSGDDIFLLHQAKIDGCKIVFANHPHCLVTTSPQNNWKDFLFQRFRWASKTTGYSDNDTWLVALIVAATNVSLFATLLMTLYSWHLATVFLLLVFIKGIAEIKLFKQGTSLYKTSYSNKFYWVVQLIHPLYTSIIVLLSPIFKVKWKDRNLK